VLPSGAARAIASVPTLPPEPERFSTTKDWPVISAIRLHQMRERMSVPPPGGKIPMKRTGCVGQAERWARAAAAAQAAPAMPSKARRVPPPGAHRPRP
jgi:hypothetical protein